ncbi:hypothetical protein B0H14DRAFT_3438208 [Mycena olivaceomarginata]|nr:hypothetical protein B0H14DRAFT_3438208 [Mycena olivaceomarginata]
MSSLGERPYNQDDCNVKKPELVRMVQRQQAKWPTSRFIPSKATVADITTVLLDPKNGFTTNKPLITSPHPPKRACDKSVPVETPSQPPRLLSFQLKKTKIPRPKSASFESTLRMDVSDMVSALQESNSSLEIPPDSGGIKISIPDSEEDGWKIPFVCMYHGQFIDEMKFDPAVLEIPEGLRIKLFLAVSAFALKAEDTAAVIAPPAPSTSTEVVSDSGTAAVENAAVQFLRGKLAERDGYKLFAAHRGRTVSNTDIVQDWQFAVDFKRDYNKIKIPVKIVLRDIQTALGIQSTWLTNAQTAINIIGTYGKIREVAETPKCEDDPPKGSIALLSFLTEWKKNHGVENGTEHPPGTLDAFVVINGSANSLLDNLKI